MKHLTTYLHFFIQVLLLTFPFSLQAQQTVAEWNFPNNPDNSLVDVALPLNAATTISAAGGTGAVTYNQAGAPCFHCSPDEG